MSSENIAKFAESVTQDPALTAKVHALRANPASEFAESLSALAAESGLPFTAEEYRTAYPEGSAELSEDQLSGVAGGVRVSKNTKSPFEAV